MGPAFAASADFALDKPAHTPCPHLEGSSCGIHATLRGRGFPGCVVFDCFGAGQQVVQVTFGGATARTPAMFDALERLRPLHEVLVLLDEAVSHGHGRELREHVEALVAGPPERIDVDAVRAEAGAVFDQVVAEVRGDLDGAALRRADLVGRDLRRRDLRGADLRGALLLGADLRGVDLDRADLLGADLRGADVRGAHLDRALFLTGPQLAAASGDATTVLGRHHTRPEHWADSRP